jgi:capsular polysaccharide biosynthesis protein
MTTAGVARRAPETAGALLAVRRRWWLIGVGLLIGLTLATLWTLTRTPRYTATATVLVQPTGVQNSADLANGRTNSNINLDTEARLLRSTTVAERVNELLGRNDSPYELVEQVRVTVPPNTEVLSIAFTAPSPSRAQQGAHAFAAAYLERRGKAAQDTLDEQIDRIQRQSSGINTTLRSLSAKLATLPVSSRDRVYTTTQKTLLQEQLTSLNQVLGRLNTTVVTPGRLLTDAQVPTSPSSPSLPLNLAAGLAGGLLLGLVLAYARGRRDSRLLSPGEVEKVLGIPVVATAPSVRVDAVEPPDSPAGHAYRRIANTLPTVLEGTTGVVMVTATTPGPAGDVVAANVAAALARRGTSVTLLQVDRTSRLCSRLVGTGRTGVDLPPVRLWDVEAGVTAPRYVLSPVAGIPRLSVVTPDEGAESSVSGDGGREIVDHLRYRDGFLVVSAPSTAGGAEAQAVAGRVDAVILVAQLGSRAEEAVDAVQQLDDVRAPLFGAVVVPPVKAGATDAVHDSTSEQRQELADQPVAVAPSGPDELTYAGLDAGPGGSGPNGSAGYGPVRVNGTAVHEPEGQNGSHAGYDPERTQEIAGRPHPFVRTGRGRSWRGGGASDATGSPGDEQS